MTRTGSHDTDLFLMLKLEGNPLRFFMQPVYLGSGLFEPREFVEVKDGDYLRVRIANDSDRKVFEEEYKKFIDKRPIGD